MSGATREEEAPVRQRTDAAPIGWRFLASRRWFGYYALLLVFSIVCVWLGNWQFDRRAEAQAEIARIEANYDAPALTLAEVVPDPARFDEARWKWRTVEVTGEYLGEPFLARNRPGPGGVGSNVIQALRLPAGHVLFVDRGWVSVSGTDAIPEDLPSHPGGQVSASVRLRASEPTIAGREAAGRSIPSIDAALMAGIAGLDPATVYLGAYGQLIEERPAAEAGVLAQRPERDEGPHLSYALQWYVFILIALLGVAYAARQEYRSLNSTSPSVLREDARRTERRRRRGPSDADEEDALLDG